MLGSVDYTSGSSSQCSSDSYGKLSSGCLQFLSHTVLNCVCATANPLVLVDGTGNVLLSGMLYFVSLDCSNV